MMDVSRLSLAEFRDLVAGQGTWSACARLIDAALDAAPVGTSMTVPSINPRLPPRWLCRKIKPDGLDWETVTHSVRRKRNGELKAESWSSIGSGWGLALQVSRFFEASSRQAFPDEVERIIHAAWSVIRAQGPWELPPECQPLHLRQFMTVPQAVGPVDAIGGVTRLEPDGQYAILL